MTYVSNDPSYWPYIDASIYFSYWNVAAGVVMVYDWVLTLGQEIELIWRGGQLVLTPKRSRYAILEYRILLFWVCLICAVFHFPDRRDTEIMPSVSLTDAGCGTNVALTAMLSVIMIARLHAMYQGSRKMLIFLAIIFLAVNIACGVIAAIGHNDAILEEFILSGIYMCGDVQRGDDQLYISIIWMLNTVWEVLALCLSVWVVVKHFRELRRLGPSTGSTIGDCFRVLIQSHILYFASSAHVSVVSVSCLQLAVLSPEISNSHSIRARILGGARQILSVVQMFVLGPRLILSVREYHAKLVAYSDAEISMNSILFQEHVQAILFIVVSLLERNTRAWAKCKSALAADSARNFLMERLATKLVIDSQC
ncbi:uncharacterized protein F5147DRAFT_655202 [Suillus discolor]|uniref:DUF6533 domain-containing protein n=1 Tax=Suillus discolor TaxID=1912936 RepID=A0A9P7F1V4_9AGAM|nr:uncharacterized protein F5147DRAFT_655202 [Suillus discolor]KAG2101551.1 hypothetical protein F5147DRAFT_655202 [Suillus discolor]